MIDPMVYVILGLNLLGVGARLVRAEVQSKDTAKQLEAIDKQVRLTNGTVIRHEGIIEYHGREIERLRDKADG